MPIYKIKFNYTLSGYIQMTVSRVRKKWVINGNRQYRKVEPGEKDGRGKRTLHTVMVEGQWGEEKIKTKRTQ